MSIDTTVQAIAIFIEKRIVSKKIFCFKILSVIKKIVISNILPGF